MKKLNFFKVCVILMLVVKIGTNVYAQSSIQAKVVPFKITGATDTYVTCVNDSNDIAGYFYNGTLERGFIYFASSADTIIVNYPGATNTRIYGINNNKEVVGSYNTTGAIADNIGFKYSHALLTYELTTTWLTHTHRVSRDINDAGCIIGDHRTNPSTSVCHISCGGNNTIFHYNYNSSFINGLNNVGRAVGFWMDAPNNNGFIREPGGTFTDINYPGATRTRLMGINDSNMVVGVYDLTNSFIYHNGVFKKFVKSGTTDFQVQDINNYGFIVGYYKNAANQYEGFYMPYCDIGFRPDPNGWNFSNSAANMWPQSWWEQFDYNYDPYRYGQAPFPKIFYNGAHHPAQSWLFPDWKLFVETFGEENCYETVNNILKVKNAVFHKWYNTTKAWGGSCFGFTQSSYMVWHDVLEFKFNYPGVGPWNLSHELYEVPLNYHSRRCINQLQIKQRQTGFRRHIIEEYYTTPVQTLKKLKTQLLDNNTDEGGLALLNQNGSGGHIVSPYKIEIDTLSPHIEYIYVYDNNQPADTTRRIKIDKNLNAWYYNLSGNANMPQSEWGGNHANKGLFVTWPASRFYNDVYVDSLKKSTFGSVKNNTFDIYNSTNSNIIINDQNNNISGFVNNVLTNNIQGVFPMVNFIGNEPPYGYLMPESTYAIEMRDFSSNMVRLTLSLDKELYVYSRDNALLFHKDNFQISPGGLNIINNDNEDKNVSVHSISKDVGEEKTFSLKELFLKSGSNLFFTIVNNDKLKIVNQGIASKYDLRLEYLSAAIAGVFEHDSITIDAHTTHIIAMNWSGIQNGDVCIYIDNGNNGIYNDTLCFSNQGTSEIITNPTVINIDAISYTDTLFIGNTGAGTMNWSASSDMPAWLNVTGGNTGTDFGYVLYTVLPNTGTERVGHLQITSPAASNSPYLIEVRQAGVLSAPQNLTASDGAFSDGVHISWDAIVGATHYMVYRSNFAGSNGTPVTGWITNTSYIDNAANGGDFYYYSVKAAQDVSGLNESGFSNIDEGWRACFTANFSHSGSCLGQPTIFTNLSSVHTNAYYLWDIDNNGTIDYTTENISHIFTTTGTKTVVLTVTDSSLCNSTFQQTINILPFPAVNLPADTVMCAGHSITLDAGTGFASYLWSTGGALATETIDSTGFGLGCGPVYLSVTASNGCTTIDTVLITWTVCTDIFENDISEIKWNIYPNPTEGFLNIDFLGYLNNAHLFIYNFNGQLVYRDITNKINGNHTLHIDLKHLPAGMYIIRLINEELIKTAKIIIY